MTGSSRRPPWRFTGRRTAAADAASTRLACLAALAVFLSAGQILAQGRPSTPNLTCGQAAGLVLSRGAVVLGTGGFTFDRFVANRSFCEITEVVERAFVPTRDTGACFIGFRCKEFSRDEFSTN